MRKTRDKLEKRKTRFHKPDEKNRKCSKQSFVSKNMRGKKNNLAVPPATTGRCNHATVAV